MKALPRALCLLVLVASGCSAPLRPAAPAAHEVPLYSPSSYRTGVVDQAIRESHERQLIRDLWRGKP
jgi:hypothetical protein